jgi:hypothetical protein
MILVGALGVLLGALPVQTVSGQTLPSWAGRPAVEAGYTQLRFDGDGSTLDTHGVGGRLMWNLAPATGATVGASGLASRTELGLYGTYTPERRFGQGLRLGSYGGGVTADVRPLATPIIGRVDPYVSLGAGALHVNVDRASTSTPAPSPLLERSRTTFALTPGAGLLVRLTPGVALRGDVRDMLTFRDDTRHNLAFGAGLRLTF